MLHIVNKSPFEKNSLESCARLSKSGSCILLIEDGVYGALVDSETNEMIQSCLRDRSVYVLGEDIQARGIQREQLVMGIEVVDYAGFVKLTVEHDKVQSWL